MFNVFTKFKFILINSRLHIAPQSFPLPQDIDFPETWYYTIYSHSKPLSYGHLLPSSQPGKPLVLAKTSLMFRIFPVQTFHLGSTICPKKTEAVLIRIKSFVEAKRRLLGSNSMYFGCFV